MSKLWEHLVRFRTYVANIFFASLILAPDILNSPEVVAVLPEQYQRWVIAAGFLVNIWMRPRPAVISTDPEVKAKQRPEFTGEQL